MRNLLYKYLLNFPAAAALNPGTGDDTYLFLIFFGCLLAVGIVLLIVFFATGKKKPKNKKK